MTDVNTPDRVVHTVTWSSGAPAMRSAPVGGGQSEYVSLVDATLGFRVRPNRWCTGYVRVGDAGVEPVACPDDAAVEVGRQCDRCRQRDRFRFVHQAHRGGGVSADLDRYLDRPHRLYLATFADGTTKVGTAAGTSSDTRLDDQGPVAATYLTTVADGRTVRDLEDRVGRALGIGQSVRSGHKAAALADARGPERAIARHADRVEHARQELGEAGIAADVRAWTPPAYGERLRAGCDERAPYPHAFDGGDHGFTVLSCLGPTALVRLAGEERTLFVVDLHGVRGRRIAHGDYASEVPALQDALF